MKSSDETTPQSATRRSILKSALAVVASGLVASASNSQAFATTPPRRTVGSGRRSERRDRDHGRHERHPRHPRVSVRYDLATNAVIVSGSKFSASARMDIKVDYDWPYLNYSVPWPIPTATAIDYTNNHGRFTHSVPVSPLGHPFTGRVEVTDSITTSRVSKNFNGS